MQKKEIEQQPQSFNFPIELSLIEELNAKIKVQEGVISEESKRLKDLREQKTDKLKIVQEKIKTDEISTGDKIKDFTIVYFDASEKKEKQLRDLENQLGQCKGEFVLLKTIESVAHGHIDFEINPKPHPELSHWEEKAQIGIINEETPLDVDVKNGKLVIASEKHCYINKWRSSKSFLQNQSISIAWWELGKLGKSIESFYSNQRSIINPLYPTTEQINSQGVKDIAMEILVGDKEVFKYLKNCSIPDLYPLIAKQLGRELKEIPPESKEAILREKKTIFDALQNYVEEERSLRKKLEEIEDLKIIKSIPLNSEHKEILGSIEDLLGEALDLEMHQTPWIIRKDLDPGKIEINVPQMIISYIEYYDFPEIKKRLAKNSKT